jgi:hypothetical protein
MARWRLLVARAPECLSGRRGLVVFLGLADHELACTGGALVGYHRKICNLALLQVRQHKTHFYTRRVNMQ